MNKISKRKKRRMADNKPAPTKSADNPAEPDTEEAKDLGLVTPVAAIETPVTPKHENQANERKNGWQHVRAYFQEQAIAIIALAVSAVAAGYTYKQANIADKSMGLQNRAYITSTAFELVNYGVKINGHLQWTLGTVFENTGNTSPRNLQILGGVSAGIGPGWNFDYIAKRFPFNQFVITPHSMIVGNRAAFVGPLPQNGDMIAAGVIKYRDIVGAPHLVEYCLTPVAILIDYDNYPSASPIRVSGAVSNPLCAKHNCEDEDCGPDWEKRAQAQ